MTYINHRLSRILDVSRHLWIARNASVVFAMIAMVLVLHITEAAETSSQPNIVLILADDFGWGDASCNRPDSKIKTPAIDRIAEEGIRFTNAHSPSAVCAPTRYGLLTGRYPWRSYLKQRVLSGYCPSLIREGRTTIPSYLKSQGYHTSGYGKWHLGMDWTPYPGDPENWRSHWKSRDLKIVIQVGTGIDHSKPFALSPIDHGDGENTYNHFLHCLPDASALCGQGASGSNVTFA